MMTWRRLASGAWGVERMFDKVTAVLLFIVGWVLIILLLVGLFAGGLDVGGGSGGSPF